MRAVCLRLVVGALSLGVAGPAWSNGAFPDSFGILAPPDRPREITLATNFGLITSEDDGATWTWSCEQEVASLGNLYQQGPPPLDRLFALSEQGLIRSDDLSCTWAVAGGTAAMARLTDFFPDPTDPMHLLILGIPNSTEIMPAQVYESRDGGRTAGPSLYQGSLTGELTGIECARGDPRVVYLASYDTPGPRPFMVKSTDGGATWAAPVDLTSSIGADTFRIIAVDPVDAQTIFLLVTEAQSQSLAISRDGGATFTRPVQFAVALTAFARLASGTILVAGLGAGADGNPIGAGFRSRDGGRTFIPWAVPQLRALVERGGNVYGAADDFLDGFALGLSTDEGMTFRPLMRFSDVSAIRPCVRQTCADNCRMLAMQNVWPASMCDRVTPSGPATGCALGDQVAAPLCPLSLLGVVAAAVAAIFYRRRGKQVD